MTGPGSGDPVEEPAPEGGLPVDDIQVHDSGLVVGGPLEMAGHNVAGRDLTVNASGDRKSVV